MKKIKIKLNSRIISNAIKSLEQYKQDLNRKADLLVQRLADEGYKIIVNKIFEFDAIDTGNMLNTLNQKSSNCYAVLEIGDCAMFVEFGTGPAGEASPYPGNNEGWTYNIGEHIKEYNINGVNVVGWFYPDESGWYRFTKGMPSRPFMYETAIELRYNKMEKIIREVFQ